MSEIISRTYSTPVSASLSVQGPPRPDDVEFWWRADERSYARYSPFAEFAQPSGTRLVVELTPYAVVKHTPKGVRLRHWMGEQFQVNGKATKQRAVPTQRAALYDLIKRKERHVRGAEARLEEARSALEAAKYFHVSLELSA